MPKKRITRAEQDKMNSHLPRTDDPDAPLPKRKRRCDKKRPTYRHLVAIEMLTSAGMPLDVVAAECEVSRDTLERWVKEYADIAAALSKGRKKRRMRAISCLYEQAFPVEYDPTTGKTKPTKKGNPDLMKFWMKTREGFSERGADEKAVAKVKKADNKNETEGKSLIINYNVRAKAIPDDEPID